MHDLATHTGGCHCGAVRFEFEAPARTVANRCNCSICSMSGFVHVIVPKERFRLLTGEKALEEYRFGSRTARHLFCRTCGVKSFYVPRSHPDGYSIHLGCVDPGSFESVEVRDFDGRNWEANVARLQAESF